MAPPDQDSLEEALSEDWVVPVDPVSLEEAPFEHSVVLDQDSPEEVP